MTRMINLGVLKASQLLTQLLFISGNSIAQEAEPLPPEIASIATLSSTSVVSLGDLRATNEIRGAAIVAGSILGPSATFGQGAQIGADGNLIIVQGDIQGNPKNINGQGNIRVAGVASAILNFNGGGELIQDETIELSMLADIFGAFRDALQSLEAFGEAEMPSPTGRHGPAILEANPDETGLAVIDISDGNLLFGNDRVQQIQIEPNGATAIIINVGGENINFNRGSFVGSSTSDEVSSRLFWNFYEATSVRIERGFEGTLFAPQADVELRSNLDGGLVARSINANARVGLPLFSGFSVVEEALSGDTVEGSVSGIVFDLETGATVANAQLTLSFVDTLDVFTDFSELDGTFAFEGLDVFGPFTLTAELGSQTATADDSIILAAPDASVFLMIDEPGIGSISGQVFDANGLLASGAIVTANFPETQREAVATSDPLGNYSLEGLQLDGTVIVTAFLPSDNSSESTSLVVSGTSPNLTFDFNLIAPEVINTDLLNATFTDGLENWTVEGPAEVVERSLFFSTPETVEE